MAAGTGSAFQAIGIVSLALGVFAVVMSCLLLIVRRDVASGIADVVLGRERVLHTSAASSPPGATSSAAASAAAAAKSRRSLGGLLDWLGWHLIPSRRKAYDYMTYLLASRARSGRTDLLAGWPYLSDEPDTGVLYRDLHEEQLNALLFRYYLADPHHLRKDLPDELLRVLRKQDFPLVVDRDRVLRDLLFYSPQSRHLDARRCYVVLTTLLDAETETRMAVKDQADLINKLRLKLDSLLARGEGAT